MRLKRTEQQAVETWGGISPVIHLKPGGNSLTSPGMPAEVAGLHSLLALETCSSWQKVFHLFLFLCVIYLSSLAIFKILSLVLSSLVMMCRGVFFFVFILRGVHGASWICGLQFSSNLEILRSLFSPALPSVILTYRFSPPVWPLTPTLRKTTWLCWGSPCTAGWKDPEGNRFGLSSLISLLSGPVLYCLLSSVWNCCFTCAIKMF